MPVVAQHLPVVKDDVDYINMFKDAFLEDKQGAICTFDDIYMNLISWIKMERIPMRIPGKRKLEGLLNQVIGLENRVKSKIICGHGNYKIHGLKVFSSFDNDNIEEKDEEEDEGWRPSIKSEELWWYKYFVDNYLEKQKGAVVGLDDVYAVFRRFIEKESVIIKTMSRRVLEVVLNELIGCRGKGGWRDYVIVPEENKDGLGVNCFFYDYKGDFVIRK